jgi:Cof subfamily protein (haloacid dehalogenase superfamily)
MQSAFALPPGAARLTRLPVSHFAASPRCPRRGVRRGWSATAVPTPRAAESGERRPAAGREAAVPPVPRVCFCDIDGTTLASDNSIPPENVEALIALPYPRVKFIPATGKSRAGALASFGGKLRGVLRERYPDGVPGVYLQGLVCFGEDGTLIFENALPPALCQRTVELARELGVSLLAYARDGDSILCEKRDAEIDKVVDYHEPEPVEIGRWEDVIGNTSIQKFLYMAPEKRILEIRPTVELAFLSDAEVTRATEGMLEVLPRGASKAAGVGILRNHLGVDATETLCIGDGENDERMLKEGGISIAMANAVPATAKAALYRTSSNDEGGLAEALKRFVFDAL